MQEDKLVLECVAKEYLQRTSVFWTSYLVDRNDHVKAVCLAGARLSYLDAIVAANGNTGDRLGSSGDGY